MESTFPRREVVWSEFCRELFEFVLARGSTNLQRLIKASNGYRAIDLSRVNWPTQGTSDLLHPATQTMLRVKQIEKSNSDFQLIAFMSGTELVVPHVACECPEGVAQILAISPGGGVMAWLSVNYWDLCDEDRIIVTVPSGDIVAIDANDVISSHEEMTDRLIGVVRRLKRTILEKAVTQIGLAPKQTLRGYLERPGLEIIG